jgi:hypothetical protein
MTLRPGDLDLHVLSYSIHAPCKTANGMRTSPKSNQIIHALEVIKLVGVCHIGSWTSRVHFETPKLFKCVTRCPKHLWLLLTAYVDPTWIRRAPLGAERPYLHAQSTFWNAGRWWHAWLPWEIRADMAAGRRKRAAPPWCPTAMRQRS